MPGTIYVRSHVFWQKSFSPAWQPPLTLHRVVIWRSPLACRSSAASRWRDERIKRQRSLKGRRSVPAVKAERPLLGLINGPSLKSAATRRMRRRPDIGDSTERGRPRWGGTRVRWASLIFCRTAQRPRPGGAVAFCSASIGGAVRGRLRPRDPRFAVVLG